MFGRERVHLVSQSSNDLNPDLRGRRGRRRRHAGQAARGADRFRRDAGVRGRRVRPALARTRAQCVRGRRRGGARRPRANACSRSPRRARRATPTTCHGARPGACAARDPGDRSPLLRHQGERASGPAARAGGGRLRTGMRVAGRVENALAAVPGLDPRRVLFTPSFAPVAEYAQALARGVQVTVDNVELLRRWPEVFRGHALWLRIDLGHGDGHHAKVTTGGRGIQVRAVGAARGRIHGAGARARHPHHRPACAPRQRDRDRRPLEAGGRRARRVRAADRQIGPSTSAAGSRSPTATTTTLRPRLGGAWPR